MAETMAELNKGDTLVNYSSTEQEIGFYELNGVKRRLFRRIIDCGNIPSGVLENRTLYTLSSVDFAYIERAITAGGYSFSPYYIPNNSSASANVDGFLNNGGFVIRINTNSDRSGFGKIYATVCYIKTGV